MTIPLRSIRLLTQSSNFLNRNSFLPGELFYDADADTVRIMDGRVQAGVKIATQPWVEDNLGTINNTLNLNNVAQSTSTSTGSLVVAGGAGIAKNVNIGGTLAVTGNTTLTGDLAVNGADLTSTATSFNLLNSTVTTLNMASSATTINVGNASGAITINNSALIHNSTSATRIAVGTTLERPTPVTGQIRFNTNLLTFEGYGNNSWGSLGGVKSVDGFTYIVPETSPGASNGELEFYAENQAGTAATKLGGWKWDQLTVNNNLTVAGNTVITGNLTVNGTTTTINATTLTVDDKNIELGSVTSPTDVTADLGGITLKGTTDKTLIWNTPTNGSGATAWTSSENINVVTGKTYRVDGITVLNNQDVLPAPTSITVGSAATTVSVGATTGTLNLRNATITAANATTLNINGANPTVATTSTGTLTLFNTGLTTVNAFNSASTISLGTGATTIGIGANTGTTTIYTDVVISGNLNVQGQTATQTSSSLAVENKNIILADVQLPGTPTNTTANGGGIVLKGTTDKSLLWYSASNAWTSTNDFDLVTGKVYKINNVSMLSSTALGSTVVDSSLTSVGTLTSLTTSGTVAANGAGGITTTQTTFPLVNNTATTINFGGAATAINIGATTGGSTLTVNPGTVVGANTTQDLFNTTATTVNAFGAATTLNMGSVSGTTTINGTLKSDTVVSAGTTATLYNTTATTVNAFGAATTVTMGSATAQVAIGSTTARSNLSLGLLTSVGSTAPVTIDMGGTYSSAPGANPKIKLWNDGTYSMGLGISSDTMEFIGSRDIYGFKWYSGATNSMTLSAAGGLTLAGSLTESSSIALKENVQPISHALDKIKQLVGVTYDRRNGSAKNEAGLIAEDVDQVLPNLVTHTSDGSAEGINYTKLTAYLIEAVKELDRKLEAVLAK